MFAKLFLALTLSTNLFGFGQKPLTNVTAKPLTHVRPHVTTASPQGLTPAQVKAAYHISGGGSGTIAVVDAYDDPHAQADLNKFSTTYGLATCTTANPCFTKHKMTSTLATDGSWALEESLDVQWAHAIAPKAKILLVEAKSSSGTDLLDAVNYARNQPNVVAVSMSWGAGEFNGEDYYDSSFTSTHGVTFFASSGDGGNGVSWPAVSPNVVGVGGTTLSMSGKTVLSETAWSGGGGGISAYETEPGYQSQLVTTSGGFRGVPDVSYNADPSTGYPVYDSTTYGGSTGWFEVGGTSAGAPQWAALRSIAGANLKSSKLYSDAQTAYTTHFRDIVQGTNGTCNFVCQAGPKYDYISGLGSPISISF